jgi:hypothetical protein
LSDSSAAPPENNRDANGNQGGLRHG